MANFAECTLIKLVPLEPFFVALTTFDIYHGRSTRFLIRQKNLETLISDENANPVLDTDIGSYIEISRRNMHLHFKLVLLHQDYRDNVTGYVRYFELPVSQIYELLSGQSIHHVEYDEEEKPKAQLTISESGHQILRKVCQDKLVKHALRRFFRDHFNYGRDELIMIYPDNWVKGFYFQCDRLNGGIVRHEDTVKGKDGREYKRVFYANQIIASGAYHYTILEDGTAALISIGNSRQDENMTIPETVDGITISRIGLDISTSTCFSSNNFLADHVRKVVIPGTVKVVAFGLMEGRQLNEIVYSEGVEEIGCIGRYGYAWIKKVTLPKKSLRVLGDYALAGAKVGQMNIPEGVTDIGFCAFKDSEVKSVSLPSTVEKVGDYLFYRCNRLSSIKMKYGLPEISEGMFLACASLGSVSIPGSVKLIDKYAFEDCSKLKTVKFEGTVVQEIAEAAFRRCTSLTKAVIPDGVTTIGNDAFYGCSKLSAVTLPDSVTVIGTDAFGGCSQKIVFTVTEGSYAESWANGNGFKTKTMKKK